MQSPGTSAPAPASAQGEPRQWSEAAALRLLCPAPAAEKPGPYLSGRTQRLNNTNKCSDTVTEKGLACRQKGGREG